MVGLRMRVLFLFCLVLFAGCGEFALEAEGVGSGATLREGFGSPPKEARPSVYYLLLNGYVNANYVGTELEQFADMGGAWVTPADANKALYYCSVERKGPAGKGSCESAGGGSSVAGRRPVLSDEYHAFRDTGQGVEGYRTSQIGAVWTCTIDSKPDQAACS